MWRTGRALTVFVTGWVAGLSLFLAPVATAEPAVAQPAAAVRAQALSEPVPQGYGTPSFSQTPEQQPSNGAPDRQRLMMGVAGIVLIALVLMTRKWRKKPMVPVPKIPKFWK